MPSHPAPDMHTQQPPPLGPPQHLSTDLSWFPGLEHFCQNPLFSPYLAKSWASLHSIPFRR